jgi:hypothetical protein
VLAPILFSAASTDAHVPKLCPHRPWQDDCTDSRLGTFQVTAYPVKLPLCGVAVCSLASLRSEPQASPFSKGLLPQPPDSDFVDALPVVQSSEDSELLSTLVSVLYLVRPVVPNSYDKVLSLLAIHQW